MTNSSQFIVVRTEMMKCRRAFDKNADSNGEREYTFLKCPHCGTEELSIPSSTLGKNKYLLVNEHLHACPKFQGPRPAKRAKVNSGTAPTNPPAGEPHFVEMKVLNNSNASPETPIGTHQGKDPDRCILEKEVDEIRNRLNKTEEKLETTLGVVTQHHVWWGAAAAALGYSQPTAPPLLLERIKRLRSEQQRDPNAALLAYKQNMSLLLDNNIKTIEQRDKTIEQKDKTIDEQGQLMVQLIAQKDKVISDEQRLAAEKDRQIEQFRQQLEAKEFELKEAVSTMEANEKTLQAAITAQTSAHNRYERVKKEKEVLSAKFKAEVKAKEEREKSSGKYSTTLYNELQAAHRRQSLGGFASGK